MNPRTPAVTALAVCLLLTACTASPETSSADADAVAADDESSQAVATGLDLRVEPFTNFYFLVRAQAAGVLDRDPALQPIIDAWMPVQDERGGWGGFWRFDLAGMFASSPAEFGEWFEEREETVPSRAGGEIPIKGPGLAMAEAMEPVWPVWLEQDWPELERKLQETKRQLEVDFLPKQHEAFQYMLDSLGIEDPELEIPAFLAWEIHPPGATTYRTNEGAAEVLSIRDLLGEGRVSDLHETLLHETTHALDGASRGDGDAFSRLRALLEERGITRGDPRHRGVPHLIMFVQSEETMRRLFDSEHVAYGDTWRGEIAPLYERDGEPAVIVRREWRRYLDDEQSMEQALVTIADEVVALEG